MSDPCKWCHGDGGWYLVATPAVDVDAQAIRPADLASMWRPCGCCEPVETTAKRVRDVIQANHLGHDKQLVAQLMVAIGARVEVQP